jgi:hypothetical protein
MNMSPHSGCRSVRICCLLTIGATILPLTLTGQALSTGHVWVQVGVNGARVTAPPPPALDPSSAGGLLLGIIRRIIVPKDKPVSTPAVSPHATAVVTANAGGNTVSLQVYLPTAHHVAVAGDATDWQPVDMLQQQSGWWAVTLPATRTVSRLHMRGDDGAWCAIPGLPATPDEYGGTVSLIVVPGGGIPHT